MTLASHAIISVSLEELELILLVICLDNGTTFLVFSGGTIGARASPGAQACTPSPFDWNWATSGATAACLKCAVY